MGGAPPGAPYSQRGVNMPDFEDLRMIDLLKKFRADVVKIQEERSAKLLKPASKDLQDIYNFHVTADKSFIRIENNLKNLYTSFNYAAVIVNDAIKKKRLESESMLLLDECLEVMIKCCDVMIAELGKPPAPTTKKKK